MICGKILQEKTATAARPYRFADSGLPDVYLSGIKYYRCASRHVFADIPELDHLLALIARDLCAKPGPLSGDEVRFLRKRLGERAADFAKAISVEPESLSRIENGHTPAGMRVDKLIRYHYAIQSGDPALIAELKHAIGRIAEGRPKSATVRAHIAPGTAWRSQTAA